MKLITYIWILTVGVTLVSASDQRSVNETIGIKVENLIFSDVIQEETIYCLPSIERFYVKRDFQAAWDKALKSGQLVRVLKEAKKEGLNPEDYHTDKILELFRRYRQLTPVQRADLDILLTDAFLLYSSHLLSGKVNPETIDPVWHAVTREGDPLAFLERLIESNDIEGSLREVFPRIKVYIGLKKALEQYEKICEQGCWNIIAKGETLKSEMRNERIVSIRERLFITGDLKTYKSTDSSYYDEQLLQGVIRFQQRHGLEADGRIGKHTVSAMNVQVEKRIEQIKVNMERCRWLPQNFSDYYIKVNIADFSAELVRFGMPMQHHKVIVGKPYRETPVLSTQMTYIVFTPNWTVPPGILRKDILPAVRKDPNYLKAKNFTVFDPRGNVIDPAIADWDNPLVKTYTFRQAPGPENALGAVKFMFPNRFQVYLHDTPTKELFAKTERTFSSGCIRVNNALELAKSILNDSEKWNMERIRKIVDSRKPITVPLKEQPDVHILYLTSWADDKGIVHFRKDIYKRDVPVATALLKQSLVN